MRIKTEEAGEGLSVFDVAESDWLVELSTPPQPPPPQMLTNSVDQESNPILTPSQKSSMVSVITMA